MSSDAPAITRFSTFLEQRRSCFWLENDLKEVLPVRRTKPDFFVRTANRKSLLVEVESFEKDRSALNALRHNRTMSGLARVDGKRFSTALQHACQQLKPYRDLGFPGLVVLDDFRKVGMPVNVDILGLHLLGWFSENAERNHVSALAWLLNDHSGLFYLRLLHNPNATYALSTDAFTLALDEHWQVMPGEFWKRKI